MPSEKSSYARFRQNMLTRKDRISRVENPIDPGMPDVNCAFWKGNEFWIEIKTPTEPVRPTTPLLGSNHPLSQAQINWHRHQCQTGCRSWIMLDTDNHLIFMRGGWAEHINGMTVQELKESAVFFESKPMEKGKWKILRSILTS